MYYRAIQLPYNLAPDELVLESGSERADPAYYSDRMHEVEEMGEEALERVLRSMVLLKDANPDASLVACLDTARVWETG
jgi:hypothetical protein